MVLGTHADTKKNSTNGEEMFNDIKEASSFWKSFWEGNRTGNKNTV